MKRRSRVFRNGRRDDRRRLGRAAARGDASAKARLEAAAAADLDAKLASHKIDEEDVSCFVSGFLARALWQGIDHEDEPLDDSYRDSDFSDDCCESVTKEARVFMASVAPLLLEALEHERMDSCCDNRCERWHELGGDFFEARVDDSRHFSRLYGSAIGRRLDEVAVAFPEVQAFENEEKDGVYLEEA